MKKAVFNFWLDVSLFLVFAGMALTGSVLKWVLPSHCGEGGGWRGGWAAAERLEQEGSRWFLGIHRSDWQDLHFILAVLMVGLILLHFVLHWRWIVCSVKAHLFPGTVRPQPGAPSADEECR